MIYKAPFVFRLATLTQQKGSLSEHNKENLTVKVLKEKLDELGAKKTGNKAVLQVR